MAHGEGAPVHAGGQARVLLLVQHLPVPGAHRIVALVQHLHLQVPGVLRAVVVGGETGVLHLDEQAGVHSHPIEPWVAGRCSLFRDNLHCLLYMLLLCCQSAL